MLLNLCFQFPGNAVLLLSDPKDAVVQNAALFIFLLIMSKLSSSRMYKQERQCTF